MTALIVTNDFPPRIGGIETFVAAVCELLDEEVVVLTSTHPDAAATDRLLPYPVFRRDRMLFPTTAATRTATRLLGRFGADTVVFGAAAPLSLMAPALRRAGADRILALSHGHETWWARVPVARSMLRRMVRGVDTVGTISDYTASRIGASLPEADRHKLVHLPPPAAPAFFAVQRPPRLPETVFRCLGVGRLIRQKGWDTLLDAWSLLLADTGRTGARAAGSPRIELVIAGDGPWRAELAQRVERLSRPETVRLCGAVPHDRIPALMATAHAFALPMRTRLGGLNPEGLGLAAVEAAASGLPVIVGDSGGAPETIRHGGTGWVVPADDPYALAARLRTLRDDPVLATAMGRAGRAFAREGYARDVVAARLHEALAR